MVHLSSSWDLAHSSGEPHTLIHVRNLQTTLPVGTDAWGRPNRLQPVLISASISLRHAFDSASSTDSVTNSTIHYGILSKAILDGCKDFEDLLSSAAKEGATMHLRALVQFLHFYLTGEETLPHVQQPAAVLKQQGQRPEPVLKSHGMKMLKIQVMLPKASLLGSGVSLTGIFAYNGTHKGPSAYSMLLRLHELRIPTLIGVNYNERLGKQMLITTVEMDRYDRMVDAYCHLEEIVVKTIEESSFQTLEALASRLSANIIKYFLIPHFPQGLKPKCLEGNSGLNHQHIRISLEKPIATTFADAPIIELLIDSDPSKSEAVKALWKTGSKQPPFPLTGRLDEWENELLGTPK